MLRLITRLNVGGPAQHAMILCRDLDSSRFATTLVSGAPHAWEADLTPEVRAAGLSPIVLPTLRRHVRCFDDLRTFVAIIRLLRQVRPAIVHTHMAKAGTLGRLAAWLCRVPIRLHTFHGHVFHSYFSGWKSRLVALIERLLGALSDCLIVLSARQQEEICDRFHVAARSHTRIVPLGLDLARFAAPSGQAGRLRAELGIDRGTPLIGFVGRLVAVKDPDLFLEIAAAWRDAPATAPSLPPPCFAIIGGGELGPALERRCRALGLAGRVRFCGWRRDLEAIYADLDAVVLTSRNEGLPVALLEAMAAGVPVLAADVGGVADLLELPAGGAAESAAGWCEAPSGLLARSRDPQVWRAALVTLLTQRQATRRRCERAQRRVLEQFSAKRLVAEIETLYLELLEQKGLLPWAAPGVGAPAAAPGSRGHEGAALPGERRLPPVR
ncbi:MAG: glycosyltransferase [Candidatus Tectomicrobia bacterium]|nr:glycosyltransferase [Candidatus Tectomicrobia bacterium]